MAKLREAIIQFDLASPPDPNGQLNVPQSNFGNPQAIRPSGQPLELSIPIISSNESDSAKWSLRRMDDTCMVRLPSDSWTVVNIEEKGFKQGLMWPGRFMARVSWPASHPVRINHSLHMLEPISEQLLVHSADKDIVEIHRIIRVDLSSPINTD
ncbi:hypothetical protein FRB95_005581 [Tulasnella sp. JGI-2019a]|nr:hypothetical protein FRB95_005581 [Tulasnella sp. JGI-2019a]